MTESKPVLVSVSLVLLKVIRALLPTYKIPDPLPWAQLVGPLAAAEDAVARFDERLAKSPIRDGAISRTHFTDACASGQQLNSVPYTQLATDISNKSTPNYAYITPDLLNDAHDGTLAELDGTGFEFELPLCAREAPV